MTTVPVPAVVATAIIAALACVISSLALLWARRMGAASVHAASLMQHEHTAHQHDCATQMESLRLNIETLQTGMKDSESILREGRLNHSDRAQALRLLRSGVSPDTAAASLGVPRLEMSLLNKVSRLLRA